MSTLRQFAAVGRLDARLLLRDPLLLWMSMIAILIGVAFRYVVPAIGALLWREYAFDLSPYHPLLVSMMLPMVPILVGIVIGFLLLDQRDDRTLESLRATPLPLRLYLGYRLLLPVVVCVPLTVFAIQISGLSDASMAGVIWASVAAAPMAPIFALFLASVAANKVQGLALTKVNGLFTVPPLFAFFVAPPWHWLFGIVPTFWPMKAYWMMANGQSDYGAVLLVGVVIQCAIVLWLARHFEAVVAK